VPTAGDRCMKRTAITSPRIGCNRPSLLVSSHSLDLSIPSRLDRQRITQIDCALTVVGRGQCTAREIEFFYDTDDAGALCHLAVANLLDRIEKR
jgi:hypothetical protein